MSTGTHTYGSARSSLLGPYRAQCEAVRVTLAAADRALADLADAAARHQQIIGQVLAAAEPDSGPDVYAPRSARLVIDGVLLHEIDPGDVVLAAAGTALATLPGAPWPQYREEFGRLRAGLPTFTEEGQQQ